jgi:hypothetical protein
MIPKGSAPERPGDPGRRANEAGLYYHPQANRFMETAGQRRPDGSVAYDSQAGQIQGDAFSQIGYRPATKEEAAGYRADQEARAKAAEIKANSTTTVMSSTPRK